MNKKMICVIYCSCMLIAAVYIPLISAKQNNDNTFESRLVQPPQQPTQVNVLHDNANDLNKGIGRFTWDQPGGASQIFTTTSTNDGQIYYQFNWDDGTNSSWLGPYTSGQVVTASHDFNTIGYFSISVIARVGTEQSASSQALIVHLYLLGDANGDGSLNFNDIDPFIDILSAGKDGYYSLNPGGYYYTGDSNKDGAIGFDDIDPFVEHLSSQQNLPPFIPTDPSPVDQAAGVTLNTNLSWTSGDPNTNDVVSYDVYLGDISPPPKYSSDQPGTTFEPGTLQYNTQYYWRIVAKDDHGALMVGPIWTFITEQQSNNPLLEIKEVASGEGLILTVQNNGESDATNVNVTFSIEGGLFVSPRNGILDGEKVIPSGGEAIYSSFTIFGIGLGLSKPLPQITINATCAEGITTEKTVGAWILLFYIIVNE